MLLQGVLAGSPEAALLTEEGEELCVRIPVQGEEDVAHALACSSAALYLAEALL
jgi:hypothetical protein